MISDDGFVKVCGIDDLDERIGKRVFVNDVDIALFLVDGKIYALKNICPHQHVAKIYEGFITGNRVACPIHGWEFDLQTGKLGGERRGLDTYEVKVINEYVYVKAEEKELNW